ncbi:alpha-galactosidase 2 [Citrus sinensis]|uniref:Alpha-galactosidase 2 n=1 Tax=Citrus sinensis TaxID=2711 RepID=A0ACB8NGD9_CITSI|nr:alpha-galactosidase 2 [Citrus sinensis]
MPGNAYTQFLLANGLARTPPMGHALADYVHAKGLRLGIYSDAGFRTCSNTMPGSLGHELQDEGTFAQWGIDYLKYDNCFHDGSKPQERYTKMSYALLKAGRPILYSIWGTKIQRNGLVRNAWRTTGDIRDKWESITSIADQNNVWGRFAGPGRWNGPLLIGYDIRSASGETLKILGNKEVIVVNQDPLGVPRRKIRSKGALEQIFKAQPIIFSRQYADLGKAAIKRKNCGSFLLHGEKLEFLYQLRLLSETCGGMKYFPELQSSPVSIQ